MGQVNIVPAEPQTTPSKCVNMEIHNNSDFANFINDRNFFMKKETNEIFPFLKFTCLQDI